MRMLKNGLIVSAIVTVPMFIFVPIILYICSSIILHFLNEALFIIIARISVLMVIFYISIKIYKTEIFEKYIIHENTRGNIRVTIFKFIIPAAVLGNFYGAQKLFIPRIENWLNIDVYMYADFVSKIEMNASVLLSSYLLMNWWMLRNTIDSSRDSIPN